MSSLHMNFVEDSKYFESFSYPAGEWQVRLTPEGLAAVRAADDTTITARLTTCGDIIRLALLLDAVGKETIEQITLRLPYLPYSRADRRFTPGDCFGLSVFADILNASRANKIVTLDVHNPKVAENTVFGLQNESAIPYIAKTINLFAASNCAPQITVLFPDKGAAERYVLPEYIMNSRDFKVTTAYASKYRDPLTGKFIGFVVPDLLRQPVLIVDDICDGGGTFIGLANVLPQELTKGLYVSHGIFSKGLDPLQNAGFSYVYTTNSFPQSDRRVTVFNW